MHGGTATAESRGEGLGATFRVRIPALAEGGAGLHHTPTDEHALAALSGVRVLIVDDDADARQWVRQILVGAQADARAVNGAAQALDEVVRFAPHVIISDLAMPSRDGFDLLLELRSRGFPAATLPAIALSAFSGAADRQKALDTGFQAFLPKPVEPRDILLALRRVLAPVSAPAVNSGSPG
jgi:CheY-like chemotaxis protein